MSSLDGARVLLVDLQEGLVEGARTQTPGELRRGARALADVARALALPLRAAVIPGGPAGAPPLITELAGTEVEPPRHTFGALADARTARWAADAGPGGLVLAGIAIEGAVFATALDARARGQAVQVVLDASAGLSRRTEEAAIRRLEAAGATTTSLASLVATAGLSLQTPQGFAVLTALRRLAER